MLVTLKKKSHHHPFNVLHWLTEGIEFLTSLHYLFLKNHHPRKSRSASFLPNKKALHLPEVTVYSEAHTPSPVDKSPNSTAHTVQCILPESSSPLSTVLPPLKVADPGTLFILAIPVLAVLRPQGISSALRTWRKRHQHLAYTCGSPAPGTLGFPLCLVVKAALPRPAPGAAILARGPRGSPRGLEFPLTLCLPSRARGEAGIKGP